MKSLFLRELDEVDKADALKTDVTSPGSARRYEVDCHEFSLLPTSPFAYWVGDGLRSVFAEFEVFDAGDRVARQGLATADDGRYARAWYEIQPFQISSRWYLCVRGGPFRRFYRDLTAVVLWEDNGSEIRAFRDPETNRLRSRPQNTELYGREGISWPLRGVCFSAQAVPKGSVFTIAGKMAFADRGNLSALLAWFNSGIADSLIRLFAGKVGGVQYESGLIARLPVPPLETSHSEMLGGLARRGWSLVRSLDACVEVSHAFVVPAVLQVGGGLFGDRVVGWAERVAGVEAELVEVQAEIDEVCFELYGISDEDRRAITDGFGSSGDSDDQSDGADVDPDEGSVVELDPVGLAAGLVSWCVGVATGRFDVRLTTAGREWPVEPDPFDPLPVCSPAMLTGDDGLPLSEPPAGYPLDPSPVLVVDPGHRLDVTGRVRDVFDAVFGANADAWWTEVGEVLDPRGGDVGSWLLKGFFEHHLKTHSKSRRKAPVVWPIGTRSGSYQVWLYAHRVTGDSLFRVLNDLVVPKLDAEESKLVRLRQEAGPNPSASERKTIDTQEKFVSELVELREMVEELAPLWAPDLNDGIVIVLAPLWRLFGFRKPWMRELKKHWGKLVESEYDWAQLAMHLWPERVIPKCADDRSLAIAHRLEDVFWEPDPDHDDKWIPRDTPTTPIDQLITDRHNPTTTTALNTMDTT